MQGFQGRRLKGYRPHLQSGRLAGVGLLAVVILLLVLVPRLLRGGAHPLAQQAAFDLCARLGDEVWTALDRRYHAPTAGEQIAALGAGGHAVPDSRAHPQSGTDGDPSCRLASGASLPYGESAFDVNVFVVTAATLRRSGGFRATVRQYFDTSLEEIRAGGSAGKSLEGPWQEARLIEDRSGARTVLAIDDGIVLLISVRGIDAGRLTVFASAVASRLRQPASVRS